MEPLETIAQITQDLLNLIMLRERDFFLKSDNSEENRAKGFHGRSLACMFGNLNLNIPRDRLGQQKPQHPQRSGKGLIKTFKTY